MLKSLIVAIAIACVAGGVWAGEGEWTWGVHPGYSMPIGDTADLVEGSPVVQVSLEKHCSKGRGSLGLEIGYAFAHSFDGESDFGGSLASPRKFTSNMDLAQMMVTPVARFSRDINDTWSANAAVGAGWYYSAKETGEVEVEGVPGKFPVELDANSDFGVNLGGGIGAQLSEKFSLGLDVRYHHQFESGDDTQFVMPTVRLNFLL